jgi:purine-binding chemotaxis protein CheW
MMTSSATTETFILCVIGGAHYGLRTSMVQHIEMVERITPAPNTPPFVEGVIFSRGQLIPVLNLRQRFGFERIAPDLRARIVVVRVAGRTVGLLVDTAREFVSIPAESIQPPPEIVSGLSGDYLEGIATIGDRLVLILDVEAVLNVANLAVPDRDSE